MSELRFNELRGEEVVYAIHRQERTFLPSREHCPLCPTLPGKPNTEIPFPVFEIAVFDNRFPAFAAPLGAAEVVVYTDSHDGSFGTLAPQRAEALMWVWRHRYLELGAREDVEYVLIFENRGVDVGLRMSGVGVLSAVVEGKIAGLHRAEDRRPELGLARVEQREARRVPERVADFRQRPSEIGVAKLVQESLGVELAIPECFVLVA